MLSGPPAALAASISRPQISSSDAAPVAEDLRDPVVGHDPEQTVGAEQVAFARRRLDLDDVDLPDRRRPTARA